MAWFRGVKPRDMGKLAGIPGGTVGMTIVDRFGDNLNSEAGIPALQLTNEVFGFYQGNPQFMIQREYYKPTVAAGFRWSPTHER